MKQTLLLVLLLAACHSAPPPRRAALERWFPGDPCIRWREIGRSVQNRPIYMAEFGTGKEVVLFFGGFHGNEKTSIDVAFRFCEELHRAPALLDRQKVVVVPILNPDGFAANRRHNARGVDLNRNFPTTDWGDASLRKGDAPGSAPASEPETQAALGLVKRLRPARIVSLHDPLHVNNYDGDQSLRLAKAMAAHNKYPIRGSIGYPTPGSFGTWAGHEKRIPVVTLETPAGNPKARWSENRWALLAAVRYRNDRSSTAGDPKRASNR